MELSKFIKEALSINYKSIDLFIEALTHRSFINENKDNQISHNERLEFLGDAVLELVVTQFLFLNYKEFNEGILTSIRSALVKTESLAFEALKLNLGEYILMSKGEENTGGRQRPYILANTMEAVIGAIFLDQGFNIVEEFIIKNICYKADEIIKKRLDVDAKSKIQELIQEKCKITPIYNLIDASGPDHNKDFTMGIYVNDVLLATGSGKSKQEAETRAAQETLENWDEIYLKYLKI